MSTSNTAIRSLGRALAPRKAKQASVNVKASPITNEIEQAISDALTTPRSEGRCYNAVWPAVLSDASGKGLAICCDAPNPVAAAFAMFPDAVTVKSGFPMYLNATRENYTDRIDTYTNYPQYIEEVRRYIREIA